MLWVSSSLLEAYSPASNSCSLTTVDPQVNPVLSIAILSLTFTFIYSLKDILQEPFESEKGVLDKGRLD